MAEAQESAAAAKGYRYSPSSPSSTSPTPSSPPAAAVHGGGGEAAAAAAAAATPAAWSSAAGDSGMQASGHGEHAGLNSGLRRGRPKGSGRRQILATLGGSNHRRNLGLEQLQQDQCGFSSYAFLCS